MRYLTLFTDENSWLALDGKVIPASDVESVETATKLAQSLSQRLQNANEEIEQRKQLAHSQGYDEGYQAGLKAAGLHNDQKVVELQLAYKRQNQQQEDKIVELALAVVKRIAGDVATDAWLTAQAHQAVASLRQPDEAVRLVVHHSQVDAVRERIKALQQSADANSLRIDSVESGEEDDFEQCRLEVSVGSAVMVDLQTQISAIERALKSAGAEETAHG